MTPETVYELSAHERKVMTLILKLDGIVQGFPDSTRKLQNVARTWAKFASTEPYKLKFNPQIAEFMSPEDKAKFAWKDGVVPAEWLIDKVADSCEWFPAPVVAREMYCAGGFTPVDGIMPGDLPSAGRRRAAAGDGE